MHPETLVGVILLFNSISNAKRGGNNFNQRMKVGKVSSPMKSSHFRSRRVLQRSEAILFFKSIYRWLRSHIISKKNNHVEQQPIIISLYIFSAFLLDVFLAFNALGRLQNVYHRKSRFRKGFPSNFQVFCSLEISGLLSLLNRLGSSVFLHFECDIFPSSYSSSWPPELSYGVKEKIDRNLVTAFLP